MIYEHRLPVVSFMPPELKKIRVFPSENHGFPDGVLTICLP
jgi:hypothetical protein